MRILILGGTRFLGRHLVEAAQNRGHDVTLFNRGKSNPDPGVEQLLGDRDGGLDVLRGRSFDAAIDTSGYVPRIVRASADLLAGAVAHATFVSTLNVYADLSVPGICEDAPVGRLADETVERIDADTYGPLKALCEAVVQSAMQGAALIVRPGLIVGPHDRSDRFTYWVCRVARGGEVVVPSPPDTPVQYVDVRDLARWMVAEIERATTGVFQAAGPCPPHSLREVLRTCASIAQSDADFVWVDQDFLREQQVALWTDLPLVPPTGAYAGMSRIESTKALDSGLSLRPLEETVRDTLAWARSRAVDYAWQAGLSAEREADVLRAWRARG